jgi:hypothetical protein
MNRGKTRPTLDELKEMPLGHLRREIAQLCVDAAIADHAEVLADAEMLAMDPDPSPERIVELWNLLRQSSDSASEDFQRKNGRLLIGGPCDGERYVPRDPRRLETLVMPISGPPLSFRDASSLDPAGPALANAIYLPETLRGKEIQVLFYRHASITVDQALVLMLARYPKQNAIMKRARGMETCPRCGTVSHPGYGLICTCLVGEPRSTPHETPSDNEPSQDIRERPRYEAATD